MQISTINKLSIFLSECLNYMSHDDITAKPNKTKKILILNNGNIKIFKQTYSLTQSREINSILDNTIR